jgi:hypothetical protein
MALAKLRRFAAAGVLVATATTIGVVAVPASASADTGGCPDRLHKVHTSDTAPYRGWACWIDNGDKIRVCDNAPNDGVHVHADLWHDIGVWWKLISEDDGADAGCDDENDGIDLSGYQRLRLRVCAQRDDQTNFACNEVIWGEHD